MGEDGRLASDACPATCENKCHGGRRIVRFAMSYHGSRDGGHYIAEMGEVLRAKLSKEPWSRTVLVHVAHRYLREVFCNAEVAATGLFPRDPVFAQARLETFLLRPAPPVVAAVTGALQNAGGCAVGIHLRSMKWQHRAKKPMSGGLFDWTPAKIWPKLRAAVAKRSGGLFIATDGHAAGIREQLVAARAGNADPSRIDPRSLRSCRSDPRPVRPRRAARATHPRSRPSRSPTVPSHPCRAACRRPRSLPPSTRSAVHATAVCRSDPRPVRSRRGRGPATRPAAPRLWPPQVALARRDNVTVVEPDWAAANTFYGTHAVGGTMGGAAAARAAAVSPRPVSAGCPHGRGPSLRNVRMVGARLCGMSARPAATSAPSEYPRRGRGVAAMP